MIRCLLLCLSLPLFAQAPPTTRLWLGDLDAGSWKVTNLKDISLSATYNNQPHFVGNQTLLYTRYADNQTDIFSYDVDSGATTRLTWTQESEYSPTPMPDGKRFSVIRVEHDGTQRLWAFPLKGGAGALLLPAVKPVGYHLWISPSRLAMFILGEPNFLAEGRLGRSSTRRLVDNIGRCFKKIPNDSAYSVTRVEGEQHMIVRVDGKTRAVTELMPAVGKAQDYAWTPNGHLVMGEGGKLFHADPVNHEDWQLLLDLSAKGVDGITRLAISPNGRKLAIVTN